MAITAIPSDCRKEAACRKCGPFITVLMALPLILSPIALQPQHAVAELTPAVLNQKIQAATAGEMSLDELAELLLREAGESDRSLQVLLEGARKIPGFGQHLSGPLFQRVQEAVSKGEDDKAKRFVELSRKFIPEGTSDAPAIEQTAKWLEELRVVLAAYDLPKFIELYHLENESEGAEAIEARLEIAVRQLSEGVAAKHPPLQALSMLALLDAATSKPSVADAGRTLLPKAVESLAPKESAPTWPFDSQESQEFLKTLARSDAAAMQSVIQLLRWRILERVAQNSAGEAQWYFNLVLGLRPDPNPENNQLRTDIAFTADGAEGKKFADGRLEELRQAGALSFFTRLRLATSGFGGGIFRIFVLAVELLFVLAVCFFAWRGFIRMRATQALRGKAASKKRSPSSKGYTQPMDKDDEYTRLLASFGLDDAATEADIKRAFREAVKRHHPDVQGAEGVSRDDDGNVDDTFQELRRNYERLLEVRGGWFGRRPS